MMPLLDIKDMSQFEKKLETEPCIHKDEWVWVGDIPRFASQCTKCGRVK